MNNGTAPYTEHLTYSSEISPFNIDKNEYIYIGLNIDNQRYYNCGGFVVRQNLKIPKLTLNFDLVWAKDIIRDTFGLGQMAYSFSPCLSGLSVYNEDNMYLTGWIDHYCNTDSNYNRTIDLGSNQRLIIKLYRMW